MISGILLAVASATAAVAVADTQQAQVDLRFDLQRSDHVVLRADRTPQTGFPTAQVRLVAGLPPVRALGEFSTWSDRESVTRSIPSHRLVVPVLVADEEGFRASGSRVIAGAGAGLLEDPRGTPVAWVGRRLADELGVVPGAPGRATDSQIVVGGRQFSVAGIVSSTAGFEYADSSVLISRRVAVGQLGGQGSNVRLVARVQPGSASVVGRYAARAIDVDGSLGLLDVTPPDGTLLLRDVGGDLRQVGAALGGFVGLVGMIAIANTLMMSVHHRMRELGLRSAMGWSRRRIGLLVLTESGLAGLAAGIMGSAAGLAAAGTWCWLQGWTLVVPPGLPLLAAAGGVAASLVGGLVPALRAASISPLAAMRS
jgi:putative ABC transport system permease protein